MRRITERIIIVSILALLLFASACALKSVRKESEATPSGSETIAATTTPTARATATPTPTRKPTPTPKPTLTPTPTIDPAEAEISFADQNAEKAFLLTDVNAKDFYGQPVELKVGQVIWIYTPENETTDETSRFFLPIAEEITDEYPSENVKASRELFFDMSDNRYGTTCFSGFPEYDLFGTEANLRSNLKRVVEVEPWEQINLMSHDRYLMRIDWDQDGIGDEVYYEYLGGDTFTFRSGKDDCSYRVKIDMMSEEIRDYAHSSIWISSETFLLARKENGNYVLLFCEKIDTLVDCSEPEGTAAIYYEPDSLFSARGMDHVFGCEDEVLYVSGRSGFFYGIWTTKRSVQLNDDWSLDTLSDTVYYLNSWGSYTYSREDVNIEIEGPSGYTPSVLSKGMVIIPEKEVLNSEGKGYLYVRLADGRKARIKAECNYKYEYGERIALLDGRDDRDLFQYTIGG
jgi:hypothetical protein